MLMTWRAGNMIGLPDMRPESLRKAITDPEKVMAPMAAPKRHLNQACLVDVARRADAEGLGRIEGGGGDQHRGHADQRMEGGDELGHRRHRDAACGDGADAAADGDTAENHGPGQRIGRPRHGERGSDRDGHADHADDNCLGARSRATTARAAPG